MSTRAVIVLQARVSSTRLPAKALATIAGTTLLERSLRRLMRSGVGAVLLATTERPEDDALVQIAAGTQVPVFRGSTDDVLGRYLAAAESAAADVVIRATGDNPAVDVDAPSRVLRAIERSSADYACEDGLPIGAGVEAITYEALCRAAAAASTSEDREHVTLYVKRRPGAFRIARQPAPAALRRPDLRFTVDTRDDLEYMRRVFAHAAVPEPSLPQLIVAARVCRRSDAA